MCFPALMAITAAIGTAVTSPVAEQYRISSADSYLLAVTGKAGLFGFAGHEHAVDASEWTAQLELNPQGLAGSSVVVTIPVSALKIDTPRARQLAKLGSGPSADDVKTIQASMLSPEVLNSARYPTISFRSVSTVENGSGRLLLTGDLTLHGHTQRISVPVNYRSDGAGAHVFEGGFKIRQTDFGMKPVTVAGGTVKVSDEVQIRFRISVVRAAP
jgi:polyisoprenoid-binding protein YceI